MSQNNQKSITQSFKSNQKQQNLTEHQSSQKSGAQLPTHYTKINDLSPSILQQTMFSQNRRVEIDYVHAKYIGLKNFHGFIMMKSNFFNIFFISFCIIFFEVLEQQFRTIWFLN